jgi:hypothetical protein
MRLPRKMTVSNQNICINQRPRQPHLSEVFLRYIKKDIPDMDRFIESFGNGTFPAPSTLKKVRSDLKEVEKNLLRILEDDLGTNPKHEKSAREHWMVFLASHEIGIDVDKSDFDLCKKAIQDLALNTYKTVVKLQAKLYAKYPIKKRSLPEAEIDLNKQLEAYIKVLEGCVQESSKKVSSRSESQRFATNYRLAMGILCKLEKNECGVYFSKINKLNKLFQEKKLTK